MRMKKNTLLLLLIIAGPLFMAGCNSNKSSASADQPNKTVKQVASQSTSQPMSSKDTLADKVQVFLFHSTQRCTTCIAIGKLAGETVNERFQEELKSGRIEFREVNIDLPENKELAAKFQASGSALFLNSINSEGDHIAQDTKVWQLTGEPAAFKDYLEGRINILLGK
jgi:hypothetical protein